MRAHGRRRVGRRLVVRAAEALATAVVLALTVALGVLVHVDTTLGRRVLVAETNRSLATTFRGTLVVERVAHASPRGVEDAEVRMIDEDGVPVLVAGGVRARLAMATLLRSLVLSRGTVEIRVSAAQVAWSEIDLDPRDEGGLRLAAAFAPRNGGKGAQNGGEGRRVHVVVSEIAVGHAWLHGRVAGLPLDADLDHVQGELEVEPGFRVEVKRLDVVTRGMPRRANLAGRVEAAVRVPSSSGDAYALDVAFDGTVAGSATAVRAWRDGAHVRATVDLPRAGEGALGAILPSAPREMASLHAVLQGELPHLDGEATATLGGGAVALHASAVWNDTPSGTVEVLASGVDARAFAATAPRSAVSASARVAFALRDGAVGGRFRLDAEPGFVDGIPLPQAAIGGDYRVAPAFGKVALTMHGTAALRAPGRRAEVAFSVVPRGGSHVAAADVRATLDAQRIGALSAGPSSVRAMGEFRLPERTLEARATAHADELTVGPCRLRGADLTANASGRIDRLALEGTVDAEALSLGPASFGRAKATARGERAGWSVSAELEGKGRTPAVVANGRIETQDGLRVHDANVTARRGGVIAAAQVAEVRMRGGEMELHGGVVSGLGAPLRLWGRRIPGRTRLVAKTRNLELSALATLIGMDDRVRGGEVAFDADLRQDEDAVFGRLVVDAAKVEALGVRGGQAHLEASLLGRHVVAHGRASDAALGTLNLRRADVTLADGARLDASSWSEAWRHAYGALALDGDVKLPELVARLFPADRERPVDVGGSLKANVEIVREATPDVTPSVRLAVDTRGLTFAVGRAERALEGTIVAQSSRRVEGLDVQLGASLDGPSGEVGLDGRILDKKGVLLAFDGKATEVPYRDLVSASGAADLGAIPVSLHVLVPRRPLSSFPFVGRAVTGDVDGDLLLRGSVADPEIDLIAKTHGARAPDAPFAGKVDADLVARYAANVADASLQVRTVRDVVLTAAGKLRGNLKDLFGAHPEGEPPWEAWGRVQLSRFPLGTLTALSERHLAGHVSGELSIARLHQDARARAELTSDGLELGGARFTAARATAELRDGMFRAAAHVERPGASADARAELGMAWGARIAPALDESRASVVELRAKAVPAAVLAPIFGTAVSGVEGTLDADARLEVPAGGGAPTARGSAVFRDVSLQVTPLGQSFHGVEGAVRFFENGIVRLENARARGVTGLVMAAATARLRGLRLAAARGIVRIPSSDPLPLGFEGVEVGEASGDLDVSATASADGKVTNVNVDVPKFKVRLPSSNPHAVESLGPPKKVRVGTFRGAKEFVLLPLTSHKPKQEENEEAPARVNVAFLLGRDVALERDRNLSVAVDGKPEVHLGTGVRMSGQVRLRSGYLVVQGKRFEIEKGTIAFVGDPSNPEVVVTAGWTAPDGTRVFADFSGPLKTGKVTLRSEPARPQDEIVALILFGTAEGSSATPYAQPSPNGATRAGTLAGGIATEGLTRGIDALTGLDVTTKIDTTDAANPRPEVEVRIARDVSLQVAFVLGTPPPGTNPDRTFATVDWRFSRYWSIATTFGDQGSSIADVVWRYRY